MTILTAGSGCAKLNFLPMLFCAPFLFYITLAIIFACYDADTLMPIKLFDYSNYSTNFLPLQTYLLCTHVTNSRFQNYELLIQR